jgi:hypothetical protein
LPGYIRSSHRSNIAAPGRRRAPLCRLSNGVAEGGQQTMQTGGTRSWLAAVLVVAFLAILGTSASALEVQLAGIRLDAPWVTVLDVYGNPDGVVVYGAAGGAAGGEMGMMGAGMPGMGGMEMGGMMPGMMPGMEMGGMMGSPAMMGSGMDMMGGMGMMGGEMGMGGPAMGGGGGGAGGFPMWALPVWVVLEEGEVEWLYRKGDVVVGFVFNPDGYVRVVAVAGEDCDYARTALWRPHRYVKLGDDFKRVLYRYGYPDEVDTFSADAGGGAAAAPGAAGAGMGEAGAEMGMPGAGMPGGGMGGMDMGMGMMGGMGGPAMGGGAAAAGGAMGPMTVTFNSEANVFSRDCVLTYEDNNNIAFTLHNMKVTRIHIWKSEG